MKFKHTDTVLIKNNIMLIWADTKARFNIIFIPLLICVFIPVLLTVTALAFDTAPQIDALRAFLPDSLTAYNSKQTIHYISTNFICVMLFPLIPVIVSSYAYSTCLIGEKENRTILALLTSPISAYHIIRVKYVSCALLSTAITLISAFCFFITASIGNIIFSTSFFFDTSWAINFFLLPPAISLFCPLLLTILSPRFTKQEDALKLSSVIVFILLVFFILEFTGLYKVTSFTLLVLTILIYIADLILIFITENSLKAEGFLDFKEE